MVTTALIVEDEPLLAKDLAEELSRLWPELVLLGPVHDGIAALREIQERRPDVLFLDIQMPGLDGLEVARFAGGRCHIVFVTSFDQHAVNAFEQGAVDYLLKPLDPGRLGQAVARLRARLARPPANLGRLLEQLQLPKGEKLQWISVLQGRDIQFIAIDDVCYFRADHKYIAVVTASGESLITTPLKELVPRLDPAVFWQVHRGVIVNMHAVHSVRRSITGNLDLKLKRRAESVRVSAAYAHLFKHM